MLGGNTNKLVWVGIALGLVGILGGSIMMFYPSAMSTVSDTISTSVSKFMKTDSSKDDDGFRINAVLLRKQIVIIKAMNIIVKIVVFVVMMIKLRL